jgi:hypothetical protein
MQYLVDAYELEIMVPPLPREILDTLNRFCAVLGSFNNDI